jgi:tetratricopeptide (TPR) repeat protein
MIRPGYAGDEEDLKRGFDLAQKALALDPFDSRNHFSLAWSWLLSNSGQRAESHFRLAVDLNPYDSETLIASAMGMAFLGNLDVARSWSQSAIQLNPLHPEYFQGYLAAIRYLDGDFSGALDAVARCLDVFPETRAWVAAAQAMLGREDEAAEAFAGFIDVMNAKWQGSGAPNWNEIQDWLVKAVPIVWQPGRDALNEGLARARRIRLARAS